MRKTVLIVVSFLLTVSTLFAQNKEKKEFKPALLIIDVQNAYMPFVDKSDKDLAIRYINGAIWLFEKYELPIIRIYHQDEMWGPEEDTEGFKFTTEVNIKEDYPMVIKHYGNAFTKTDLDKILKEKGINSLFLCGLSATGCVMATNIGANDHDYKSFLIKNALLSPNASQTDVIESIMSTVDIETIAFMFEYLP